MKKIVLGVAYYPEHDSEGEWGRDLELMSDLGINAIRIGEFCWNRMQKSDGTLTLDWLERLIDLSHSKGISTILCTPTATPPIWLCQRFPDLPLVLPDGRRGEFGGRRHYSVFHEGYREWSMGIAEALAQRFGKHPGVIGWHIDNEVGSYSIIDCSPPALRAFHRYLARTFTSVEEMNHRWGLIFWNQEVERFDQVPAPTQIMATRNPQYLIAYNRFCLEGWSVYILDQAQAIRRHKSAHQWIVGSAPESVNFTLFRLQRERGVELLDHVELNNYPELLSDPTENAMRLDRIRAVDRPRRFLTLEQQAGSGYTTTGGIDSRVRRFWAWETVARGSLSVVWFHWRRFRTGCEWRHTSVVERDRKPRSNFKSIQSIVREIRKVESILLNTIVESDIQVFFDPDSAISRDVASEAIFWIQIQQPDGWRERFPLWEREVRRAIYQPLTACGLTIDFVLPHEEWDPGKPVIVPDMDFVTPALVEKLKLYCEKGGRLICFPAIGDRNEDGALHDLPPPGLLASLLGVELGDYYPLVPGTGSLYDPALGRMTSEVSPVVPVSASIVIGSQTISVDVRHGEILDPRDSAIIARYAGGSCDGLPAATRRSIGKGWAVYLGAVPLDPESAILLFRALLPELTLNTLRYSRIALTGCGRRYEFLLNDSSQVQPVQGHSVHDLITGSDLPELPPYGVALIEKRSPKDTV